MNKLQEFAVFSFLTWASASGYLQENFNENHDPGNGQFTFGSATSFMGGSGPEPSQRASYMNSVNIVYPKDIKDFYLEPSKIIGILDKLPGDTNTLFKVIELSPYEDPDLVELRKEYGDNVNTVAQVELAKKKITIFNGKYKDRIENSDLELTVYHEVGHLVDKKLENLSEKIEYRRAFKKDGQIYASAYSKTYANLHKGAKDEFCEDFADVFALMVSGKGVEGYTNRMKLIRDGLKI